MRKLNFNEILKSVDDFYGENDNKNRLFNVARKSISILFDRYYGRTQKEKDFNLIDGLEREEIFYQALNDFLNDLSKDIQ